MKIINWIINKAKTHKDKLLHIIVNIIIVVVIGCLFNPAIGLGAAIIASILKETYDEYQGDANSWDWKDLVADVIGIIIGIIIVL